MEQQNSVYAKIEFSKTAIGFKKKRLYSFFKRLFDLFFSLLGILLVLWLMIIIAFCIKAQDGGKIFYNRLRVTKDGKVFKMLKFRTMVPNAEQLKKSLMEKNETNGKTFKMKDDPRITKIGRLLRKTSLDELPQLFNVLIGSMSFVGPRPPLPEEVEKYKTSEEYYRLSVKQGLTCIWQVSGRSLVSYDEQIVMDNKYIQKRGLATDFLILLKTIPAVLFQRGAE